MPESGRTRRMPRIESVHRAVFHTGTGPHGQDGGAACGPARRNRTPAISARGSRGALLQRQEHAADRSRIAPHFLSDSLLDSLVNIAMKYQDRVDVSLFHPQVEWRNSPNQGAARHPPPRSPGQRTSCWRGEITELCGIAGFTDTSSFLSLAVSAERSSP